MKREVRCSRKRKCTWLCFSGRTYSREHSRAQQGRFVAAFVAVGGFFAPSVVLVFSGGVVGVFRFF